MVCIYAKPSVRSPPSRIPLNEPVQNTSDASDSDEEDKKSDESVFNLECRQGSTVNGAYSLKECHVVMISGTPLVGNKPNQQVGTIRFEGINPNDGASAKDIQQSGTLYVAPFGSIYAPHTPNQINGMIPKALN